MELTTLTSIFLNSKDVLRSKLESLSLPKDYNEAQRIVNNHITQLLNDSNAFKESLNTSDTELLNSVLRISISFQQLNLARSIDFKTLSTRTEYYVDHKSKKNANDIFENTLTLLPALICAFINPWLTVAVGGGTVLVKNVIETKNGHRKIIVKERKIDLSHQISEKEVNAIINGIEKICFEVDGIIDKIRRDRADLINMMQAKINDCVIEKMYPQILSSLQYLLMEDIKSEHKSQYIQNLLFSLQGYGYRVVEYTDANAGLFVKKMNPNVAEKTMYLPAIVKDIENIPVVVSEGIVYIPKL